jgi:pimeloyl-ACP methyl ester carboxylesterase
MAEEADRTGAVLPETAVETRRGRFVTLSSGPDDAPLVLCFHGFPDCAYSFEPLVRTLSAAGYRGVAPFLRGYFPSTVEGRFDVSSLADDFLAIADALAPGRQVSIVGHDWGAVISYFAMLKDPERFASVVTMSVPHPVALFQNLRHAPAQLRRSWYIAFFQLPVIPEETILRDDLAFIDRLWRDWSPSLVPPPEHMARVKRCLLASLPAPLSYYRSIGRPLEVSQLRENATLLRRHVTVPTLHLTGAADGCIGPELGRGQHRMFDGPFETEVIRGAGHFLQLERPAVIEERVLDWLSRHPPDRAPRPAARAQL